MKAWAARGRGRPQYRRDAIDQGTPETQAQRLRLANGADPVLTAHPLGLMLAQALIGRAQHDAGCLYAFLYGQAVGRPHLRSALIYEQFVAGSGTTIEPAADEQGAAAMRARFRSGKNRLLAAGRRVCDATENVAVFQRMPRFLDPDRRRAPAARRADAVELEAVQTGLEVLAACYGRAAGQLGRMADHRAPSLVVQRRRDFFA